jgi:DNA polymerase III subunit alpha
MEFVEVENIESLPYKGKVYDLEVEVDHCYTANDYSVHNSAAGSLVNYLLKITDIDPLKHDLLFERFLDMGRKDLPDIDSDFEPRIRDSVIHYMIKKFGKDNVAPIGTFGILKTRSAILDVARVCNIPPQETMAVTTKLPKDLDENDDLATLEQDYPALKAYLDKWEAEGKPLRYYINGIRGGHRQAGQHAAGVLLSSDRLIDNVALIKAKKGVVTGWVEGAGGRELSDLGYAKYDILGLNNLQVINDSLALIKKRRSIDVDITHIDLDDSKVYTEVVKQQDHMGVFQFESGLARKLMKDILPDNFNELSDISALLRPGPLKMHTPEEYANRKHNRPDDHGRTWTPDDIPPILRPILGPTFGLVIYQEQVMQIAEALGNFSKYETNNLRKLIIKYGKVSQDDPDYQKNMKKYHDQYIENAAKPDKLGDRLAAEELWQTMAAQASYAFNRSHSISYTYTSIREYWLKCYYAAEFNVTLLNHTPRSKEKKGESILGEYITNMMRKGFVVAQPSINECFAGFTLKSDTEIVWGLGWIKNLPEGAITAILDERKKNGKFESLDDLYKRVGGKALNKRAVDALVWSGCLDEFGNERSEIAEYIYTKLRGDKKYVAEKVTSKKRLEREIELLGLSLNEMISFKTLREEAEQSTGLHMDTLTEVSTSGEWYCVGKVVKLEKKQTKTKKDYIRISLKDETTTARNIYCWPWQLKKTFELHMDDVILAKINNDGNFVNLTQYQKVLE